MLDDVFDDADVNVGSPLPSPSPSNNVRYTSSDGTSDEDRVSVCSLDDGMTSSRPRCLSTSLGVSGPHTMTAAAAAAAQCISVSTDRLWSCVLSMAVQDGSIANVAAGGHVVRCSRSQENYIDMTDMICVDINIDENVASSVEALHYHHDVILRPPRDVTGSTTNYTSGVEASGIANLSTCEFPAKATSDVTVATIGEEQPVANHKSDDVIMTLGGDDDDDDDGGRNDGGVIPEKPPSPVDAVDDQNDVTDGDNEPSSVSRPKDADIPSAARLAKRLYHLDGFRRSDISPHLNKK